MAQRILDGDIPEPGLLSSDLQSSPRSQPYPYNPVEPKVSSAEAEMARRILDGEMPCTLLRAPLPR
jgi:hypothetical protein